MESTLEEWDGSSPRGLLTHHEPDLSRGAASQLRHLWRSGKPREHHGVAASRKITNDPSKGEDVGSTLGTVRI